jgi:hypothetical protein
MLPLPIPVPVLKIATDKEEFLYGGDLLDSLFCPLILMEKDTYLFRPGPTNDWLETTARSVVAETGIFHQNAIDMQLFGMHHWLAANNTTFACSLAEK